MRIDPAGYGRYFIGTENGWIFEVTCQGIAPRATFPEESVDCSIEFTPIFGRQVVEMRSDDLSDLAILVETGHVLLLTSTFNGSEPGNNFYLQEPEEAAEWKEELKQMRTVWP
jgi:hypothetical protein